MTKGKLQQLIASLVIAALVVTSMASLVSAAPVTDAVRSTEIAGTISGSGYNEIWLDLEVGEPGTVTLLATWGTNDLGGKGFFVLDENDVANVIGGGRARDNNLATGNPMAAFRGDPNQQEAVFRATAPAYKLIIYNESGNDATFTISSNNAFIVGDNENVTDPNAVADDEAAEGDEAADGEEAAEGQEATTDDTAADDTDEDASSSTDTEAATPAAAPATTEDATVESTDTVTTTATTESDSTSDAMVSGSSVVEATMLEGELPEKDEQHFLGLKPQEKDGRVTLSLLYEPQDNTELERRINFWVLDEEGFKEFLDGETLSRVAIAAGSSNVDTAANERAAEFKVVGLSDYTVIVYNSSTVPATYSLTTSNAILVDDSGQTTTAQDALAASTAEESDEEAAEGEAADAAAPAASTAPASGTTTSSTTTSTPDGETYTIQSGDSMSAIARDNYGDIQLYDELCAYNNIENCDQVEVGDVIVLPPVDELGSGATAPATPAASTPAATTADDDTSATETDSTTDTESVSDSTAVTTTDTVTSTAPITATDATTGTTTADSASGEAASVVDALAADGRFQTLIAALDAANLVETLEAEGPFTVFAPTDAAFAALPAGALEQLVAQLQTNPRGQLLQILLYHVSSGELASADITDGLEIQTLQGNSATVAVDEDGNITVNGAVVSDADIAAGNGLVHALEAVILPPIE